MARAGAFAGIDGGRSVSDLAWLAVGKAGRGDPYVSAVLAEPKPRTNSPTGRTSC